MPEAAAPPEPPVSPLPAWRHVFVYGTLRRGQSNDITRLEPAPRWVGEAWVHGVLYDLGPYPGLRLGGDRPVRGEVYAVTPALEQVLDAIEEVFPQQSGEYARREVPVWLGEPDNAGRAAVLSGCLLYEINPDRLDGRPELMHGDWVRRGS